MKTALPGWLRGRALVIALPFGFLLLFFLLPFLIVGRISVAEMDGVVFSDLLSFSDGVLQLTLRFSNYLFIAEDTLYVRTYAASLQYAAATTVLCLFIGYPFAYFMARAKPGVQPALLMLVMLPFWTSFLLRVYAWRGLLTDGGWAAEFMIATGLDQLLYAAGLISTPGKLMHTPFSLVLGMTYTYLPFMVLPLYANLVKHDHRLLEAAYDLGAGPLTAFFRITVPLSFAGIVAGCMLVFIPAVGEFVIPELLGGPSTKMIGKVLWEEYFTANDWPRASAIAIVMLVMLIVPIMVFHRFQSRQLEARLS